jgi:hypothetical protein
MSMTYEAELHSQAKVPSTQIRQVHARSNVRDRFDRTPRHSKAVSSRRINGLLVKGEDARFLAAVIEHARGRVEQIHLQVVTTNSAAYNFYRHVGFVTCGVEPRALRHAGRDYDEAMMVLLLK